MSAGPLAVAGKATAQKVFICYRRGESASQAGRLYEAMVRRFGESNVFMDVDMAPGVDFVEQITEAVSGCLALIVVIGPTWATVEDEEGARRIEDPADFVRLEVETGLSRPEVTPIPVLVSGAGMPQTEKLPPELRPLTRRNAVELSEGRWRYDVGRLFDALDELLPDAPATQSSGSLDPQPLPPPPSPGRWRLVLEGMAVAAVAAFFGRALAWSIAFHPDKQHPATTGETVHQIGSTLLRQGVTGAVTGAALAVWLAYRLGRSGGLLWLRGLLVGALAGALGGTILGLFFFLPEPNLPVDQRGQPGLLAVPAVGALLGALIGSIWRPARLGAACLAGAAGGLLFQLIWILVGRDEPSPAFVDVAFGLAAAAIAGLALAAMVLLDRE
jgi:hypothetical protein